MSHVRPALIVVAPPRLDQPLCLGQGSKPVDVQALVPERSVEGLDVRIVRRGAGARNAGGCQDGLTPWILYLPDCGRVPHQQRQSDRRKKGQGKRRRKWWTVVASEISSVESMSEAARVLIYGIRCWHMSGTGFRREPRS